MRDVPPASEEIDREESEGRKQEDEWEEGAPSAP